METFSAWMRLEIPRSKSPLVPSLRSAATAKLTSGHGAARSITAAVRFQNHDEQRNHLETSGGKIRGTNRKRWHFWNQNNDGKTPLRFLRLAMEICTKNRSQSLDWDAETFNSIVSRGSTKGQIPVAASVSGVLDVSDVLDFDSSTSKSVATWACQERDAAKIN